MEDFFITFLETHSAAMQQWGVLILFFVAFIESLPILGTFLPGQATIIFGGFLVKLGFFGFFPALVATILGAMLGDFAGFILGKKYGPYILSREKWIVDKKHLETAVRLVEGNGIKSIFMGRMHSFARTLMPFAAGMSKINIKKFIAIDAVTAILWATLCLAIGYIFGQSFELAAAFIGKFTLIFALIALIIFAAISHMRENGKKILPVDAALFGVSVCFLYLFTITASGFSSNEFFHILDTKSAYLANLLEAEWLSILMISFSNTGGPIVMTLIVILLLSLLLTKKRFADGLFVALSLGSGIVLVNLLKAIFHRERPILGMVETFGSSFPSGHAMIATISMIILYYVQLRKIKNRKWRGVAIFVVIIAALAIGLSRVYLNVHWASDVFAGFFAGIFFATFAIVIFRLIMFIIKKSKRTHTFPDIP